MKSSNFSILVNTCDKFEDCWDPFFKLFSIYWPEFKGRIYLNTEYKDYSYNNLNIYSLKVCNAKIDALKITWSECLIRALENIEDEIVLYMQEDYFIKSFVQNDKITDFANTMINNDIDCIHLTDQNSSGPFSITKFDDLWLIDKNAPYRISCQAALWKKSVLLQYIRTYENPWQFEKYGTKRSKKLVHKFYTVNRDKYKININEIIPYVFTGIIRGYWFEEVVELFLINNIQVDFTKRGFVKDAIPKSFLFRIRKKIKALPSEIRSQIELILI